MGHISTPLGGRNGILFSFITSRQPL